MNEWVTIAHLIGARGNRGELRARALSGRRFSGLDEVFLFLEGESDGRPARIESVWEHQAQGENWLVFKFSGVDTISEAECLAGAEVRVPASSRAELPGDEFYQSDLIGCQVVERASGRPIGTVSELQEPGGPVLLKVDRPEGELLIPFARSICANIDVKARRIEVDLPEGLDSLNR